MILTTVHKRQVLKNVLSCMSKFSHQARYTSTVSSRYPDYYVIYQNPHVRAASVVNRLKIYQTVVSTIGIPVTMGLAQLDLISPETIDSFCAAGLTGCILLYTLGFFGQNIIAFIYVNEDYSNVKIAYCNFWGRRIDIDVPLEDIVPLTETPTSITKALYCNFHRYSTKKTLKLYLKQGDIVDTEKFYHIFGKPAL